MGIIRRLDLAPFVVGSTVPLVLFVAFEENGPVGFALMFAVSAAFAIVPAYCYLDGPAAYVRVDPGEIVVSNTFVSYSLPRNSLRTVEVSDFGVKFELQDGRKIRVRAFEPALVRVTDRSIRSYRAKAAAFEALLSRIAPERSSAMLKRRWRVGNLVVAVLTVLAFALGMVYAAIHHREFAQA